MSWAYSDSRPRMFFDQNFRVLVAVAYNDAVAACKRYYGDGFVPDMKTIQEWQTLHRKKDCEVIGRKSTEWAEEFFNERGVGY